MGKLKSCPFCGENDVQVYKDIELRTNIEDKKTNLNAFNKAVIGRKLWHGRDIRKFNAHFYDVVRKVKEEA